MERTDDGYKVVVCDAGPIIHLDELGCLPLLNDFADILVPNSVWQEVCQNRPTAVTAPGVSFRIITRELKNSPEIEVLLKAFTLHAGEYDALKIAKEYSADLLLTDDAAARLASSALKIPVHGTVGIIIRSIRRGQKTRSDVATILRSIPAMSTLHLKPALLHEFIRHVEDAKFPL